MIKRQIHNEYKQFRYEQQGFWTNCFCKSSRRRKSHRDCKFNRLEKFGRLGFSRSSEDKKGFVASWTSAYAQNSSWNLSFTGDIQQNRSRYGTNCQTQCSCSIILWLWYCGQMARPRFYKNRGIPKQIERINATCHSRNDYKDGTQQKFYKFNLDGYRFNSSGSQYCLSVRRKYDAKTSEKSRKTYGKIQDYWQKVDLGYEKNKRKSKRIFFFSQKIPQ